MGHIDVDDLEEGARRSRVKEASKVLEALGFAKAQYNDRSSMILLALLQIQVDTPWERADSPMLGVSQILDWVNAEYATTYKPNTRETFRRQTLHQFVAAGLVQYNFDNPARTVNDRFNNYRIAPPALELLRLYGTEEFGGALQTYLELSPGLAKKYAAEREMTRLPVALPDGGEIRLSAGGQNVLLKSMVEEFCPRFTPGGHVLYIGDADLKLGIFEEKVLSDLGVELNHHGKFPDLIVYIAEKNWLVLMEAASSHGPVDGKRYEELRSIFGSSSAGLVYVSCFPDRATMRKFLSDLAWETEAWAADEPTHMIHLNGSRFLGPYEDDELASNSSK